MKKSKIKSLCNVILCIFVFSYIYYSYCTREQHSKYDVEENELIGTVNSIVIDGAYLQLEILAKEKVLVTYYFKSEEEKEHIFSSMQYGNIYKFRGVFKKAKKASNKNLFSYHDYLLSKKIYWIFETESIEMISQNSSLLYHIKNLIYKRVKTMKNYSYFYTFIVGDSSRLEDSIKQKWQRCGVSHLLAISGMHMGLFLVFLHKLLHIFSFKIRNFLVLGILLLYVFIVGFSISVVRSFLFAVGTILFKNKISKKKQLIFIAIFLLCYNPYYIYSIGFLFSFVITFFILCMLPIVQQDRNYMMRLFHMSWISFLASVPIISISFFEVNILSVIVNLIMIPFVSFVFFPMALLAFLCPPVENFFEIIIRISENIIQFLDVYTRYTVIIPKMPFLLICIYYIILFFMIRRNCLKGTILILVFLCLFSHYQVLNSYVNVVMMDVGQGDCILLQFPYQKGNILIDTGGIISYNEEEWERKKRSSSLAESIIIPYLKSEGIHKLDTLLLTHGDYDHMGETVNLVENFKVDKVIFNCGEYNDLERNLIKILDKKNIKYDSCIKELNIDKYKLQFLDTKEYDNENDNSNVIYFNYNSYKFLFMGDAGIEREKDILDKYNLKDIDFLKVGHHGSNTGSSKEFIESMNPKYSLISVGKNNKYGHPKETVLDNLQNSKIYRTDIDGSLEIKLNKNGYKIRTCSS